jgi:iron complex outermembrane receptor protein
MLQKRFFLLVLLCCVPFLAYADCQAEIRGALHNHTHEPVNGVIVMIKELNLTTISDEKGAYQFSKICAGTYTFVYQAFGYKTLERVVWVGESGIVEHDFALEEGIIHLEETVVSGKKLSDSKQESLTENNIDIETIIQQQGKSLGELLQNIAGINTLQTGANIQKPILHGLSGNRLPILQSGVRLESQQWGSDHAPEIDAQGTQRISVVKGASAIRYGSEAIGGVILTDYTALPTEKDLHIWAGTGVSSNPQGLTSNVLVEMGNKHHVGFRFQTSAKYLGDTKAPTYTLSNTGTRELNFSTAIGIKKETYQLEAHTSYFRTTIGVLRSAHIGNLTDLSQALTRAEPWYIEEPTFKIQNPRQEVQHSLTKLKYIKHLSDKVSLHSQYSFQWNDRREFDIRRGALADRPAMSLQLASHALEKLLEYNVGESWENTSGLQLAYQHNDNQGGTGNTPLVPDYESQQAGIFTIHRYRRERFSVELGARADYKKMQVRRDTILEGQDLRLRHNYSFQNANFTAGFLYKFTEKFLLRTNVGTAWRPPHAIELFAQGLHHGAGSIEQGNRNLQPEKAWKALATLEYRRNATNISFTGYVNRFANFLYLKPATEGVRYTIRGAFPVLAYTQTQARFAGMDLNMDVPFKLCCLSLAYQMQASAVWAKDISAEAQKLTPNANLIGVPPITIRQGISYTKESLGRFRKLYALGQVQWTLRQMNAPRGLTTDEINGLTNLTWQPSPNDNYDFAPSPAGYALVNFRIGTEYNPSINLGGIAGRKASAHRWGLHLEVNNLLNTRYRSYLNRLRYYADEVGRNITVRLQYFFN